MTYLLHAYDHTDANALDRRMAARPAHFEGARAMKARGEFILGGAILDPAGKMIGSMMLVEFSSDDAVQDWLKIEPYVTGKVWEKIDLKPFRLAEV